jgi:hypothetical protein
MDVLRAAPTRAGGDSAGALMVVMCINVSYGSCILSIYSSCPLVVAAAPRRVVAGRSES